jgi:dTDP-glucose 4,6-dehydratase
MANDTLWTGSALDELRSEFGDAYTGRTVLVTGADGFMGSHLTDALVELGATVHAFVRATSSGALNNIGHLRDRLKVHFADLTDRTSIDYLVRELKASASDRPYIFHLGAQAHVGESWHRPYETVAANVLGTLNLLQAVVDATAKVAADFLTMNYHDAFGVPGVVTRMFNNYGPRQNPRYVTGTIITQALTRETIELGALDPLRDFCFCADGVRGHLTVAAQGTPGDVYVYGQGENISMRDWVDLILRVGEAEGFWPGDREVVSAASRHRPGSSEVMALRVGHEKLTAETGWQPRVSWEEGVLQTIRWYSDNRERWIGRVDWLATGAPLGTRG